MAARDEVIRYVYEVSGSKELQDVARQLIATGDVSEELEQQIRGVADEFGKLSKEANQAQSLQRAAGTFKDLARAVLDTEKGLTSARAKVAELGKAISATDEPTKKQVREFDNARSALERLTVTQTRQRTQLGELKLGFDAAGLSTRNLVATEKTLTTQLEQSKLAMAGLVTAARQTVTARQASAAAEQTLLAQLRNTVEQQRRAASATESLQRAREILAQRSQGASATERNYASSLGTSAAKIAAIGAAALGINGAVGLARSGIESLIDTAGKFQSLDVQLEGVFGNQSTEALERIQKFARETPFQLAQVSEAFVKLKAFGLDPLDGTFEAISDQAAKLGGSQETLTGITLALGQAWAKQKLQGEEILQLVERGVPVWDLLTRATGKNVQELQKLSEAGKLGRTEIKLLIDQIGQSADGAASKLADTLPGQINRLKSQWESFLNLIANSGVLEYLETQLKAVSAEVERMAATGELQEWARSVASAIVTAAESIAGVTRFLINHREAITTVALAYGSFKAVSLIGTLVTAFGSLATTIAASTASMAAAGAATTSMVGPLGLLAAALTFTGSQLLGLVDGLKQLSEVEAEVAAAELDLVVSQQNLAASSQKLQEQYVGFADVVVEKSSELASKSGEDTQAYIKQLQGAIEYTRALGMEAIATGDNVGRLAARAHLDQLEAALEAARTRMVQVREESALTFETIGKVGAEAAAAFDDLIAKGKSAKEAVDGVFKDIDFTQDTGLAKAAQLIAAIGARGTEAGQAIRRELREQIVKLSDEDFEKFKRAAPAAFASAMQGAGELEAALKGINLQRLGVDIQQITTGFSKAGKVAVDSFNAARTELDGLGLTATQRAQAVSQAFDAAFGDAKTKKDLEALRAGLLAAFQAGEVGAAAYGAKIDEINAKIASIGTAPPPAGQKPLQAVTQGAQEATAAVDDLGASAEKSGEKIASQTIITQEAFAAWMTSFGQTSKAAADEFGRLTTALYNNRQLILDNVDAADGTGFFRFAAAINEARRLTQEGIDRQRAAVTELEDSYINLTDAGVEALVRQSGGFDQAASSLEGFAEMVREGRSQFNLLGEQELSQLASSAQQAADKVRQIGEAAKQSKAELADMASSIQDQIDQLEGNQSSSENRRYQRELEQIREKAERAGAAGAAEAAAAIAAAERLHALRMANIAKEEAAARAAANAGESSSSGGGTSSSGGGASSGGGGVPTTVGTGSTVVNITLNGQTVTVRADSQAEANRLIELLRRAGMASGGGGSIAGG